MPVSLRGEPNAVQALAELDEIEAALARLRTLIDRLDREAEDHGAG